MGKHLKYAWYVIRHKWFVFLACCRLGIPLAGVTHDWSKFRPREWGPYANFFYGTRTDEVRAAFNVAWLHRQNANPHHCEARHCRCLVATVARCWRTGPAQAAITGKYDTKEWYMKNRDTIQLHPETRSWVEQQLGVAHVK